MNCDHRTVWWCVDRLMGLMEGQTAAGKWRLFARVQGMGSYSTYGADELAFLNPLSVWERANVLHQLAARMRPHLVDRARELVEEARRAEE